MQYILDFAILAALYFTFFYRRWKSKEKDRFIVCSLTYLYICLVLFVTLMPFTLPIPGVIGSNNLFLQTVNLVPFSGILEKCAGAEREIILNVIMMMPFGFFLPIIKKRGLINTAAWTFIFSLSIETTQLLYVWSGGNISRIFDVTDLITNTIGGILGYLIYLIFKPLIDWFLRKNQYSK